MQDYMTGEFGFGSRSGKNYLHRVQAGPNAQPGYYQMGTVGSLPWSKVAGE